MSKLNCVQVYKYNMYALLGDMNRMEKLRRDSNAF